MDTLAIRTLTTQLADDLAWLEDHCRRQPDQANHAGKIRFAAALVRNSVTPYLDGQVPVPLHVAVVGGAGAGKSTVANMLSGAVLAEANPQAGFTRHPIAFTRDQASSDWPAHAGFLGPLQRLTKPSPSSVDADVYQVRRVPSDNGTFTLLENFIVWDCPDMTTWAASGYVPRLLEVAALADVVVYVASDERYNDEVPTQFLHLLLQAGKAVVVCLVKMRETDASAMASHFQKEVLGRLGVLALNCLSIPQLTQSQLADPVHQAGRYRIPLLNQVSVLGSPPPLARRRTVTSAMQYLLANQEQLLSVARNDVNALQAWRSLVRQGRGEFDLRYRNEYLTTERFHRFDEALVRLLDLLELPGIGKFLSTTLYVVRTPYRLLKSWLHKATSRPPTPAASERLVLDQALAGWTDHLRKEALRRAGTHPVWAHIQNGFNSGLGDLIKERYEQGFRCFQLGMADEVDRTARAIYEDLQKNPVALNVLRGTKFTLEVAAITGAVVAGGINVWDILLVPLAASITHQLVELLGQQYVDTQREQARDRQLAMMRQHLSAPLAEWLAEWPSTGGSAYERLQLALRRIPEGLKELRVAVGEVLEQEKEKSRTRDEETKKQEEVV
jgi:hypothetical protein